MISTPGGKIFTIGGCESLSQSRQYGIQDIFDCPRGTRDWCDLRYELDEEA
jgi:hypothetical protein